ncbi:Isopenicillin N synthase-like superfamily protein [Pleurotus pulmonarius]
MCDLADGSLHAQIWEGSWAGYKPQGYYNRPDGAFDYVEHYDLYPWTALRSRMPNIGQPLLKDVRQFIEHNHFVILRKILAILSLGLGLEIDTLWKIHHRGNVLDKGVLTSAPTDHVEWQHTKDHLRYAMYHPPTEEDRIKKKQLWVPGHTDLGSVTFLYSQPIAGLQVLTAPDEWKYVRHYPDHIIVDLGDSIEFLTGGILKASPHRVIEPPEDQRHLDRLGIFYFVPFLPDTILKPIDHPSIRKLGSNDVFEEYYALGGKPITAEEWLVERSKLVGKKRTKREKREPRDILEEIHFRYNPSS